MHIKVYDIDRAAYDEAWRQYHKDDRLYQAWSRRDTHWIDLFIKPPPMVYQPNIETFVYESAYLNWYKAMCNEYCDYHSVQRLHYRELAKDDVINWFRKKCNAKVEIWQIDSAWGLDWDDDCAWLRIAKQWWANDEFSRMTPANAPTV